MRFQNLLVVAALTLAQAAPARSEGPDFAPAALRPYRLLPPGAEPLPDDRLRFVESTACGEVEGEWIPGVVLPSGYWISHTAHAIHWRSLAGSFSGRRRARALSKARAFKRRAKLERDACLEDFGAEPFDPVDPFDPDGPTGRFPPPDGEGTPYRLPLILDTRDALALVVGRDRQFDGELGIVSNLRKLTVTGGLGEVMTNSVSEVAHVLIGPANTIFLVFERGLIIDGQIYDCQLARVLSNGTDALCIENDVAEVYWHDYDDARFPGEPRNPPIQFDASGGAYYVVNRRGTRIIRKFDRIDTRDVHPAAGEHLDLLVLPDGSVAFSGRDYLAGGPGHNVQLLRPRGELSEIAKGVTNLLRRFPDGRIYIRLENEEKIQALLPGPHASLQDFIGGAGPFSCESLPIETGCGRGMRELVTTANRHVFGLLGPSIGSGAPPFRLYPSPESIRTSLGSEAAFSAVLGSELILAGQAAGTSKIVSYDSRTKQERLLYSAPGSALIMKIAAVESLHRIVFELYDGGRIFLGALDPRGELTLTLANDTDSLALVAFE